MTGGTTVTIGVMTVGITLVMTVGITVATTGGTVAVTGGIAVTTAGIGAMTGGITIPVTGGNGLFVPDVVVCRLGDPGLASGRFQGEIRLVKVVAMR